LSSEMAKAMWYFSLPFDILALAMVGYYLAKRMGYQPELGALLGVIVGTLLVWLMILRKELGQKGRAWRVGGIAILRRG